MVADTFHSAVKQNTDFTIIQTGSYHFPLTIRPPTKMEEKIAAKNKRVIQIGLNTHSHDHEINPVTFSTAKIKTKATIGSILDRWDFFSVCITEPPQIPGLSISLLVYFLLTTCTKTGIVWQTIATIDNATISEYDVNGLKYCPIGSNPYNSAAL